MIKQPRALLVLFFSEFVMRFSYWGIQSLLILYLINNLHLSKALSYEVFGVFTALTFALSILGGLIADNFFGYKKVVIFGVLIALLGNILLCISGDNFLFFGLACINYGVGVFLPNNSNLLGSCYDKNDALRDRGFTIFYMGTNMGGLLGPIFSGFLALYSDMHYAFLLNAIFLVLWLLFYLKRSKSFCFENIVKFTAIKSKYQNLFLCLVTILIIFLIFSLLNHPSGAGNLLAIIGVGTLVYVLYMGLYKYRDSFKRIMLLVFMGVLALVFFACEFQVNSSLLEFINQYLHCQIGFFTVPTQAFAALEPAFVIIASPMVALIWKWLRYKNREPSALTKIIAGVFLSSLAFFVFGYAANLVNLARETISISWVLGGDLILGIAEICIMPTLISSITRLAPAKFKATLMGALYVALASSGYLAGILAKMTGYDSISANAYMHTYFSIAIATAILSCLLAIIVLISLRVPVRYFAKL